MKRIFANLKSLSLGLIGLCIVAPSFAQKSYPEKPIKMVVPYVAGGAADITARLIAQSMSESMGQSVIVENRPGANGVIGTEQVAKMPADGYNLLFTASGPLVVNPVMPKKLNYDPIKDFVPISAAITYQYAVVVLTNSPLQNVGEIVNLAKQKPKEVSYGSTGIGGGGHLAGELLGLTAGVEMTHVPYKGAAPMLADLLGGHLTFTFEPLVTAVPLIKAGKLRAFAVSSATRSKALPSVPTLNELGYKGFNISQFQGLLAPAGTDPLIVKRLHEEVVKALKVPTTIKRLVDDGGNEIVASTPTEFANQIQSELKMYSKLIQAAHIQAE